MAVNGETYAVAPAAWSAVGYQIRTEPERPIVGQEALITVSTTVFGTGQDGASPEPFPMPEFPWEFVADAPSGARHTIALTPTGTSQSEWLARFTFDEVGDWEVGLHPRHLVSPPDPALGARSTVTVVSYTSDSQGAIALVAVAAAFAVVAVLGLTIRRRRSTTSHDIPEHQARSDDVPENTSRGRWLGFAVLVLLSIGFPAASITLLLGLFTKSCGYGC